MSNVVQSIEIIDDVLALGEFEKQIRGKGFSVYQIADRVLYELGCSEEERESFNYMLKDSAFVLNLDRAKAKLVYVNKIEGRALDSKTLMRKFASENDVGDVTEGIPVSLLSEFIHFIGDYSF